MKRFSLLSVLMCFLFFVLLTSCKPEKVQNQKPNVLWIYIEDICPLISCYGVQINPTPNIDLLAENGVQFNNCFAPTPVCSPTRSALITGVMPSSYNMHNHHSSRTIEDANWLPDFMKTLPEYFQKQGYYTFNHGKDDYNFMYNREKIYAGKRQLHFWYSLYGGGSWNDKERGKDQPWFGQIQLEGGKHVLENRSDTYFRDLPENERIDRSIVEIPPYYPEHPVIREDWARHHDAVRITDKEVGAIIKKLKDDGELENTLIFFFSDHGYKGQRHKQFCYDSGLKVPLIISYFGQNDKIEKGIKRNDLVSLLDVSATTLALAGLEIPDYFECDDVLTKDYQEKDYVISTRDRCDFSIDMIRTVRSKKYRYIKNFMPQRAYMQSSYREFRPEIKILKELYENGKLNEVQSFMCLPQKPEEELYDLENDPYEIKNLANDPEYAAVLREHRETLNHWMTESGDMGLQKENIESLRFMIDRWGDDRCINPEYDEVRKNPIPGSPESLLKM